MSQDARPSLRQLEYAMSVAEHGHFGRAAQAALVSQPGLSGQIRELEKRLGVQLFERTTRRVGLTAAGQELIERASVVLREVDDLVAAARAHRTELVGTIRFAAIPTIAPYLLPRFVQHLRMRWPHADLELHELQTAAMIEALERGGIDLGIVAVPYETGRLHVEPLAFEPFLLAVPETHELADATSLSVSTLADMQMLLLTEGHCLREHVRNACDLAGQVAQSEVHDASLSTIVQMVAAGGGVTLLPASAISVEARTGNGIVAVPFDEDAPGRTIAMAWRPTDPRASHIAGVHGDLAAAVTEQIAS